MNDAVDFQVRRDDLRETRTVTLAGEDAVTLAPGEALLRVDRFALTANNVTYAVAGDSMRYWDFFPSGEDGWGRVPVWGYADVVASEVAAVPVGTRVYGYLPPSSWLRVTPVRVGEGGFSDGSAHRSHLHPVYNGFQLATAASGHGPQLEAANMLLRPLFTTSFLIDDALAEIGAPRVLLTSASSKTALGTARCLRSRPDVTVVGLTSPGNVAFCEGTGDYDAVVAYDDLEQLPRGIATTVVDMAGNAPLLRRIHEHLPDDLVHSMRVGITHWQSAGGTGGLPGPEPTLFFAPDRIRQRVSDWGAGAYEARVAAAFEDFVAASAGWMTVREETGVAAVTGVWQALVDGEADPAVGHVLSLAAD